MKRELPSTKMTQVISTKETETSIVRENNERDPSEVEELDHTDVIDRNSESVDIADLGRQDSSIKLSESIRSSTIAVIDMGKRSTKVVRISESESSIVQDI